MYIHVSNNIVKYFYQNLKKSLSILFHIEATKSGMDTTELSLISGEIISVADQILVVTLVIGIAIYVNKWIKTCFNFEIKLNMLIV